MQDTPARSGADCRLPPLLSRVLSILPLLTLNHRSHPRHSLPFIPRPRSRSVFVSISYPSVPATMLPPIPAPARPYGGGGRTVRESEYPCYLLAKNIWCFVIL